MSDAKGQRLRDEVINLAKQFREDDRVSGKLDEAVDRLNDYERTGGKLTADSVRALVEQLPRGTIWHTQINELIEYTKLALVKFRGPPA